MALTSLSPRISAPRFCLIATATQLTVVSGIVSRYEILVVPEIFSTSSLRVLSPFVRDVTSSSIICAIFLPEGISPIVALIEFSTSSARPVSSVILVKSSSSSSVALVASAAIAASRFAISSASALIRALVSAVIASSRAVASAVIAASRSAISLASASVRAVASAVIAASRALVSAVTAASRLQPLLQ